MLARGVAHVVAEALVHFVDAALDGFAQPAAPDDGVEAERHVDAPQFLDDEVAAEGKLVHQRGKPRELPDAVADVAEHDGRFVLVDGYFRRGGARVDDEYLHGPYSFFSPAAGAASRRAMHRLSYLQVASSPREVSTTGRVAPCTTAAVRALAKRVMVL